METKRFKRTREDFTCETCMGEVTGNGYTNHCPSCLTSKHVDDKPGDRASLCGGIMKPTEVDATGIPMIITHKCERCRKIITNKASEIDSVDMLIQIAQKKAQEFWERA